MKKNEEKLNILEYEYKTKNLFKKNNRNYGIDLVRILSMILIINLLYYGTENRNKFIIWLKSGHLWARIALRHLFRHDCT